MCVCVCVCVYEIERRQISDIITIIIVPTLVEFRSIDGMSSGRIQCVRHEAFSGRTGVRIIRP
jgi:hypothetical protein